MHLNYNYKIRSFQYVSLHLFLHLPCTQKTTLHGNFCASRTQSKSFELLRCSQKSLLQKHTPALRFQRRLSEPSLQNRLFVSHFAFSRSGYPCQPPSFHLLKARASHYDHLVAPLVGAWIETTPSKLSPSFLTGCTFCGFK